VEGGSFGFERAQNGPVPNVEPQWRTRSVDQADMKDVRSGTRARP